MSATSDKVVAIAKPYLGPATEAFLARQCKAHLKIELAELNSSSLKDLAKWVEIGGGLVMDPAKAAELARKVAAL
jgi:hypothetical protein